MAPRCTAADAVRSHLDATLLDDLGKANQSLNQAVGTLQQWGTDLAGYQLRAAALEQQAAAAQQKLTAARTAHQNAAANPDLRLAGHHFITGTRLRQTQQRIAAAAPILRNAAVDLDAATDALTGIRYDAQDLYDQIWSGCLERR